MAEFSLRASHWLTVARIRNYSILMLAISLAGIFWLIASSHHLTMPDGQPLGADFSDIYTAGQLAREGHAATAYDWPTHHAAQRKLFGPDTPFYGWCYPPPFFLVAAATALVPYPVALFLWQAVTLCLYLYAMRYLLAPVAPRLWLLPTLAFSGVFINLINGHNGFLTAFLFGLGLAIIRKKPFLAGLLLGALCYKPQFGLVIPFALLAAGYWRSIAGASVSVIALCAASTALFGPDIWPAFMASLGPTTHIVLEQGNTGWYKIQSLFSLVRNVGGSIPLAYTIHFGMAACITAYTVYAWRKHGSTNHTNALLMCASLLVTPYAMDYDLTLLAPVLAFLAISAIKQGLAPYEGALLCLAWATPLLARILLEHSFLPLGLITLLLLFIHTAYRHTGDTGAT